MKFKNKSDTYTLLGNQFTAQDWVQDEAVVREDEGKEGTHLEEHGDYFKTIVWYSKFTNM